MTQLVKQNREPLGSLFLYHVLKWSLVSPLLHTYFRAKIYDAEKVPRKGPFILVSNHASYFDPVVIASAVGRPVAYMAKEELFKVPVLKQAITLYGAYPVKRSMADRQAIKSAISALGKGWAIGIFLEGTRTSNAKITDPKLGAALIASLAQVPILPVSLWGSEHILNKGSSLPRMVPLTIRVGEVISAPENNSREELLRITQNCADSINSLHNLGR